MTVSEETESGRNRPAVQPDAPPRPQADETGYLARTLRTAALTTLFVLAMLASYAQYWALLPLSLGAALALALLVVMDRQVRILCTPNRIAAGAPQKKGGQRGPRGAMLAVALIKYPLVAVMIWAVIHRWHADLPAMFAFAGGYALIHFVIALRAIGRAYFARNQSSLP